MLRVPSQLRTVGCSVSAPAADGKSGSPQNGIVPNGTSPSASGAPGASGAEADERRKPSAYLGLGTSHYDGRHSEGNRFIVDKHL